jgi:hypothetical protein
MVSSNLSVVTAALVFFYISMLVVCFRLFLHTPHFAICHMESFFWFCWFLLSFFPVARGMRQCMDAFGFWVNALFSVSKYGLALWLSMACD